MTEHRESSACSTATTTETASSTAPRDRAARAAKQKMLALMDTTTHALIPTALAHLDAAEALAHDSDDVLLAADVRYTRTTLTLASGTSSGIPAIASSDLTTHLESAADALDQYVARASDAAVDLLTARAEITALLLQREHHP